MSSIGWIKLHRQLLESRWGSNLEMMGFWSCLLMMANHKMAFTYDGTQINPGQFMTSRDALASKFKLNPSKVYRMMLALTNAKQIEQRTSSKNTIITILNWHEYQEDEQQTNNKRTTGEQRANTNKNDNNAKNERSNTGASDDALAVLNLFNSICGKALKPTPANLKQINARLKEKYALNEFESVIISKHGEWSRNADMAKYVRPATLFGPNFGNYLDTASNPIKTRDEKLADFFAESGVQPLNLK